MRNAQRGAVLIVGLIMLLLITMIGVTAMQVTTQQERMAGNLRDRNIAFQAAEMALRAGERDADNQTTFDGAGHYRLDGAASAAAPLTLSAVSSWAGSGSIAIAPVQGTAAAPRYMLEHLGVQGGLPQSSANMGAGAPTGPKGDAIRVSTYAVGGRNDTVVVLQSTFIRVHLP